MIQIEVGFSGMLLINTHQKKIDSELPSGNLTYLWKITIFNGKIHYKWPFSIAFCMFTRGYPQFNLDGFVPCGALGHHRTPTKLSDSADVDSRCLKAAVWMPRSANIIFWLGGWALPLWKIWVSQLGCWIPNWMESHKSHVPNHQPVFMFTSDIDLVNFNPSRT